MDPPPIISGGGQLLLAIGVNDYWDKWPINDPSLQIGGGGCHARTWALEINSNLQFSARNRGGCCQKKNLDFFSQIHILA